MRTIRLGSGSVRTSALGFGCVSLTTHHDERDAMRVLERAFDQGITHFDVARMYGMGRAEGILGRFVAGKRDRLTIATKFGLEPAVASGAGRRLVGVAKQILRHVPALERRAKAKVATMSRPGAYGAGDAERNLAISLRELRTDYVDVLLLHEAALSDAADEELQRTLERFVADGRVRAVGVGTAFANLRDDGARYPSLYSIFQFDSNAVRDHVRELPAGPARTLVTHTAVQPARALSAALRERPDIAAELARTAAIDPGDESAVGGMLLRYALSANRDGAVLFATMRPERVTANVRYAEGAPFGDDELAEIRRLVGAALAPADSTAGEAAPRSSGS